MKKKSLTACLALMAVSGTLMLTQCKKPDNGNSKVKLLTSASWKYKEAGIDADNNGTAETPIPAGNLQSCDTDNTITFKTDTTGVLDEGPTKCDATYPQTTAFKYSFNASTNVINFSTAIFAGISGEAKVLDLSATQMRISKPVQITGAPISLTVIVTLVH